MSRVKIIPPRREDRALLGSNPSARPGAEAWLGTGPRWSPTLLSQHPTRIQPCFSLNAKNPIVHNHRTPIRGVPVGQMSLSEA
jgi:hypothetical protein